RGGRARDPAHRSAWCRACASVPAPDHTGGLAILRRRREPRVSATDTTATAQIGVIGLAVMGSNLARNLARNGYRVALYNRTTSKTDDLVAAHGDEGTFVPSPTLEEFVASLERPRTMIIMVKAGRGTDAVIDSLMPLLEKGDIVVDGGNAHYEDTRRREAALREVGLHFV